MRQINDGVFSIETSAKLGRVSSGVVTVDGTEIMGLPEAAMRNIRSSKISLIFQEPATSLNPVMTVGDQIVETILLHTPLRGDEARAKALDWLKKSEFPSLNAE